MAKQREKRLTKREKKEQKTTAGGSSHDQHIHCIACGRHLDPGEFQGTQAAPPTAQVLRCQHGSNFASCARCAPVSQALLDEHDRTGQPVRTANAWH